MTHFLAFTLPLLLIATLLPAAAPDPQPNDYFWAHSVQLPAETNLRTFDFTDGARDDITFMEGVEDVTYDDGRMHFTLASESATIGWGNYRGRQTVAEIDSLFQETNHVSVIASQDDAPPTEWRMHYWGDGQRIELRGTDFGEDTLTPGNQQTLTFHTGSVIPVPDGLEFVIRGEPGTRITLQQIDVQQDEREGYIRKQFTLPEGEIWRATAEVAGQPRHRWSRSAKVLNHLYVNGEYVDRTGALHIEHTRPVDIKPFLKPGQANAIGMYGYRINSSPMLFVQATIIMTTGEVIRVGTDDSWTYTRTADDAWSTADYDDADWEPVSLGRAPNVHVRSNDRTWLRPSYEGYLHFKNPDAARLTYNSDRDVSFEVVVPEGLAERQPTLTWHFASTDNDGQSVPIAQETVSDFTRRDGSLVYTFNVGQHDKGVYTLAADLTANDGETIERRPREPVLVIGKLDQRPIEDNDWYGSLDTELETEIDFTDLTTDRPWIAAYPGRTRSDPAIEVTDPTIIEVNGKRYRETEPLRGAFFSYRLERFEHPGDFYLIEMTYPDDVPRHVEVMIGTKRDSVWTNARSGVGAETGGKFYQTGEEQTLRWIHVADPGVHSIDVVNVEDGKRAAAGTLRIHRIRGDLPTAQPGTNRAYGIFSERTAPNSGVATGFGVYRENEANDVSIMARTIRDLQWALETAARYTQYLNYVGQNTHIMGVYQYHENNTPYVRPYEIDTARVSPSLETVLAETFNANGITFHAGVEWSQFADLATVVNNAQVAQGADTIWMIDAQGKQYYGNALFSIVPNWLHPTNQAQFQDFMADLTGKYAHLEHFKGLHFYTSVAQRWEYYPPGFTNRENFDNPFLMSYDDITFEQFQAETGVDLGIADDAPDRFSQRARAVQQDDVKQTFVDWRARQFHQLLKVGLEGVRQHGDHLELIGMVPLEEPEFLRMWAESDRDFSDLLKDYGYDLKRINQTDGLKLGMNVTSWRETFPVFATQDPYRWIPRTAENIHEAFADGEPRYVMVRNSWDENIATTGGETVIGFSWQGRLIRDGWIFDALKIRAHPQPSGYHAREAFAQVLIAKDPNLLMGAFIDLVLNVGYEQELGSMLASFTHLPEQRFEPVADTGFETNLAIRRLEHDGRTWFYVVNPGYWHIDATLHLADAATAETVGASPQSLPLTDAGNGLHELAIRLEPYDLFAFVVDGTGAQVDRFDTGAITDHERAHMSDIADRVRELLGDSTVQQAVPSDDMEYLESTLTEINTALDEGSYALAWHRMTHYRFWSLWKNLLEKAADGMALLPDQYRTAPTPGPGEERTLTATRIDQPINVDGNLDKAVWQQGAFAADFTTAEGSPGLAEVGVQAAYDEQNIYLAFVAAEVNVDDIKATATSPHEFFPAKDDAIVIFLQPQAGEPLYYQLGFNTEGLLFHQRVLGGDRDYTPIPDWHASVQVLDNVWTAEVVLPRAVFGIGPDADVRVNFHRVMRDDIVPPASWSSTNRWHNPDDFGHLELE
ncbi:hypothetical protein ACERK3_06540 [Phycisphaerales bacterium AB-hyl4]|uniref:Carbohydrate-binding domain-containing protein n=1 Tax=Natronomicrosphaera hydrolytica TaxID=3242702 RepID=A0ABV4U652_9BACT